jgi:hypothetical protein
LAAALARARGRRAIVFDAAFAGAASPAAAGLFKEAWAGTRFGDHFRRALPVLEQLFGLRSVSLRHDDGRCESFLCVPPSTSLEKNPLRQRVTAIGDGWLEADGARHEGLVYVAAGVWCDAFMADLEILGKVGTAFVFAGARTGRIREVAYGRQAVAFERDAGSTYFSDGTAALDYTDAHERQSLDRAASFGLASPMTRLWGRRPYTRGGPLFVQLSPHTWLATGGRKMGTILGASFARRLIEEELP